MSEVPATLGAPNELRLCHSEQFRKLRLRHSEQVQSDTNVSHYADFFWYSLTRTRGAIFIANNS